MALPAILRRHGILDGHGALVAPDHKRPDDGVFVSGLSGAGKSTLAMAIAADGGRLASDDSVAIHRRRGRLDGFSRRSGILIAPEVRARYFEANVGKPVGEKLLLDGPAALPAAWAPKLQVKAMVFLQRDGTRRDKSSLTSVSAVTAYRHLIMAHPILTLDAGARPVFQTVRALSDLPSFVLEAGLDLLDPRVASRVLSLTLPK